MLASLLALPVVALAQEPPSEPMPPATVPAATEGPATIGPTRSYLLQVNGRGRYLWAPKSVLDLASNAHDEAGDTVPARPGIAAYAMGAELVVDDGSDNGIFYVEYIAALIEEGYWDDIDNPQDPLDGSWIRPEGFGLVVAGADYAREVPVAPWLSFLFGGGLGVAVTTGQLTEWEPGEDPNNGASDNTDPACGVAPTPAYERQEYCPDDGALRIPPVLPMVDVNVAARFNFSDRASLRVEGGLHNLLYVGGALGITF
jgi:hypothetical protein